MREMSETHKARLRTVFAEALLPQQFRTTVRRILKDTPEYQQALAEGRAKDWLDQEATHLCNTLAAVTRDQLTRLDP